MNGMGLLARSALVSVVALTLGSQALAQESMQFIDGGDLLLDEPARPAAQPAQSLAKDKAGTATTVTAPAASAASAASSDPFQLKAKPKIDGVRFGADIKLDESDKIELREASRMSFQSDLGVMPGFGAAAVQNSFGAPSQTVMTRTGLDERALFTKSASVNLSKPLTVALLREPQAVVPHYAGLRIGYAEGFSAEDPLGFDPTQRGFEVYLNSTAMSTGLDTSSLAYTSAPAAVEPASAYSVGFNMGYRGFTLAGSYLRGRGQEMPGYQSYDLGLSYNFGSWVTSVAVGGYFAERDPLSMLHMADIDQVYSVEIGAAYELRPGIQLRGRLKFFDSRTMLRDTAFDGLGGSFWVGTSFGF